MYFKLTMDKVYSYYNIRICSTMGGQVDKQGRSHAFESEGAQSPKAILGPFCQKEWEGPSLLLLLYGKKSGGPPGPLGDYGPVRG